MQRYQNNVQDRKGNAVPNANVYVRIGSALALIYADDGVTLKANPTTTDDNGEFFFYAANETYQIEAESTSLPVPKLYPDVILFDPTDANLQASSIQEFQFVPNGTAGPFTLGMTPDGPEFVEVFLGPNFQPSSTYTLTGNQITFSEIVPAEAEIITAKVFQILPIGGAQGSAVSFIQAGAGAVLRDMQSKVREASVTPQDFMTPAEIAAVFLRTGVDVSGAMQLFLNYISSNYVKVRMPRGLYVCLTPLTVTLAGTYALAIEGDGPGLTDWRMNTGGNGLQITCSGSWWVGTPAAPSNPIFFENLSVTTENLKVGTGIEIIGASVAGRPNASIRFDNVEMTVALSPSTQGWATWLKGLDTGTSWFNHCKFISGPTDTTSKFVVLDGTAQANSPTEFYFNNCSMTYGGTQIEIGDYCEGVYITQGAYIGAVNNIVWDPVIAESGLHVTGGHFSASLRNFDLTDVFDFEITGALLYRAGTTPNFRNIEMDACARYSITGNVFKGTDVADGEYAVSIENSPNDARFGGYVGGNSFGSYGDAAVWLKATSRYANVGQNSYRSCTLKILNQAPTQNTVARASYRGNQVFTLVGGAPTETVDVALPTGTFSVKPGGGFVCGIGSANDVVGSYDYDSGSTTATNARATLRRLGGGNLIAGGTRVSYQFFEDEDTSV